MGIFRLPGQASRIQALKELYDSGSQEDFSPTEDVHTVASLLKLYLRELPQPVVPFVLYDSYKQALEGIPLCTVMRQECVLTCYKCSHYVTSSLCGGEWPSRRL